MLLCGVLLALAACCPVSTLEAAPREHDSARAERTRERPKRDVSFKRKSARNKSGGRQGSLKPSGKRPGPVVTMPSLDPGRSEPNFDVPWPGKVVGPGDDMEFKVLKKGEEGQWIYETPHFELRSDFDLGERTASGLGRLLETGYETGMALPCNSPVRAGDARVRKYGLFVFAGQEEFVKTLGNNPIYRMVSALTRYPGIYLLQKALPLKPAGKAFALDKERQPTVLKHELLHLLGKGNEDLGMWYIEGMAEYMLCTPYADGVFHFDQNEKSVLEYATGYNEVYQGRGHGTKIDVPMSLKSFMNLGMVEFIVSPARQFQLRRVFAVRVLLGASRRCGRCGEAEKIRAGSAESPGARSRLQGTDRGPFPGGHREGVRLQIQKARFGDRLCGRMKRASVRAYCRPRLLRRAGYCGRRFCPNRAGRVA